MEGITKSTYGKKAAEQQNTSNCNPAMEMEIAVPANDEEWGVSQLTLGFTQFEGGVVDEADENEQDLRQDTALAQESGVNDSQDVFEYRSPVEKKREPPKCLVVRDCELDLSQSKKKEAEDEVLLEVNSSVSDNKSEEQSKAVQTKPQKPLPPVVAAAAKKKKKGPTDKALLEENYDSTVCGSAKQSNEGVEFHLNDEGEDRIDALNVSHEQSPVIDPSPSNKQEEQQQEQTSNKKDQQTSQQTILINYSQIENIGKALSCPICCHSLRSSTFLPCGHAFCRSCLSNSLSIAPNCPVCRLKCTRRSGNSIRQLDEIVAGYKGVLRAFGFAPVVYSNRVGMTQLSPGMDGLQDEDGCDGDNGGIGGDGDEILRSSLGRKKRKILGVDEALEHHQSEFNSFVHFDAK